MQLERVALLLLALAVGCRTPAAKFEEPLPGGLLVRVVDEAGRAVVGAEVRALLANEPNPTDLDCLWAGRLGKVECYGRMWLTDAHGEMRLPAEAAPAVVIARQGERWGASLEPQYVGGRHGWLPAWAKDASTGELPKSSRGVRTIVLQRDESLDVLITDAQGRPGAGAEVSIHVIPSPVAHGVVDAFLWNGRAGPDGSLAVPHAQFWRGLQGQGSDVEFGAFVFGGRANTPHRRDDFPAQGAGPVRFEVEPSGWVDVRLAGPLDGEPYGNPVLSWLDAPDYLTTDGRIPTTFLALAPQQSIAVAIGHRFALTFWLGNQGSTEVAFDGPTVPGERVQVALGPVRPVVRITGRLVRSDGTAIAACPFLAHLERGRERIETTYRSIVTDAHGRFQLDVPECSGATLHVDLVDPPHAPTPDGDRVVLRPSIDAELRHGQRRIESGTATVELGDVVCGPSR